MSIIKKIFSKKSDDSSPKESGAVKLALSLKEKSQEFSDFIGNKIEQAKNEFFTIKDKCNNLPEANYKLGLKHLENGNLSDAIFRFRFTKKFWPNYYDTYYQLAYCLVLDNKSQEAKKILEDLAQRNPSCSQEAKDLLVRLTTSAVES